jgi:hypothetical protein
VKRLLQLSVLTYMVGGGDKLKAVLYILSENQNYKPAWYEIKGLLDDKKRGRELWGVSGNVKDLVAAELSKYNKSTIEYVSLYCRPYVYYDDDLNPIITNRQKIAAHLIKNFDMLVDFCEACKKRLPSIKEQIRFRKYSLTMRRKLASIREITIKRFPEISISDVCKSSIDSSRILIQAYPIKKLNIFDVYSELKAVLKIIPPDLRLGKSKALS